MWACRPAGSCPAGRRLSFSHFATRASPAFPLGGRTIPPIRGKCPEGTKGVGGWPLGQTDEGADFGLGSLYAGGYFAAPAASYFLPGQKVTKEPPRGGRNRQDRLRRPCLHADHPLDPHFTGLPLGPGKKFPARKI